MSRQQQPPDDRENEEPDYRQEYEEWSKEQDALPPHEVTYADYLESQK